MNEREYKEMIGRPEGRPKGSPGGAILVVLLVLLAMTALGLLGITSTSMQLKVVGNEKLIKQAQYIAEAGLISVAERMQSEPGQPWLLAAFNQFNAGNAYTRNMADFGPNGVFNYTVNNQQVTLGPGQTMGFENRPIDFVVTVEDREDMAAPSCGQPCCSRLTFTSQGMVGIFQTTGGVAVLEGNSQRRVRAQYIIGHMYCL